MEEISSRRRSSNDDYGGSFSNSLMEPTVHDVMSLELSHHSLGDSYLDPRSFGDGSSFEEFGGAPEGRYDMGPSGYDQAAPPAPPPPPARPPFNNQHQHQVLSRRFEQGCPPPVLQRSVPTYPVKTADPSTCTQYAPVRTMSSALKPPSRRSSSSRSSQKKEPMDPKTVEDEVARNVSQILSATKQQKLAQEAQQRCGIFPPVTKINFSCSDCGKAMTSHRNLQRHRQSSCCKKVGEWVDRSQCWPEQWNERDRMSEDSDSLPGMGGHSLPHSSFSSESSGWCSPNNSYSPSNQLGALDPANMAPLSLDTDDSQTHSSSASHCSSASNGAATFTCDSCKKSVCSLRSLKRHQTTCKQYIQEFGPPPDSDVPRMRPLRRPKVVLSPESRSESPESPRPVRTLRASEFEKRSVPLTLAAADSTQDDEGVPKQSAAHTTCADCNRQLCSASNLKRHRATCKMALNKSESPSQSSPLPTNYSHVEIPARERSIIDRSYAAAVAASEQMRVAARQSQPPNPPQPPAPERPRQQYTAYIVTSPRQKPQPWVTVGEHLRAKHVQQRMLEAATGPKLEDSSVVPSSHQSYASESSNGHVKMEDKPLKSEHDGLKELAPRNERFYRGHHTLQHLPPPRASEVAAEIPPLDSIITTQPLSGDRLSGIPVLVHDSRQTYTSSRQPPAQNSEFQCPECKKTYSCRKNVKRHRMAVHKLSADDISRFPGPTPCATAVMVDSPQLSPALPRMLVVPRVDPKAEFKTETVPLATTTNQKEHRTFEQQQRFQKFTTPQPIETPTWRQSRDFVDDEESAETARIAAELKRSAEMEVAELAELEEKKSRPELAEADTTFNEETDFSRSQHSSPGTVSTATGPLPPLSSWMSSKPLSVEVPYGSSRSEASSPLALKRPCLDNRAPILSDGCTEDSLSTGDPMLGHGPSSAPRTLEDDCWFKKEEVPDSTTSQRADRSTSPCVLMDHAEAPALGSLPYTRKRALSGGSIPAGFLNDPKQARHLCQVRSNASRKGENGDCGKFYSSEWNLERHRRESCPTKTNQASPPAPPNDDISVLMGSMRFVLSRAALTRASASFAQLFNVHDPAKGELRLEGDPLHFQMLLDVYNNPANLTEENIDCVASLAAKYKFAVVTDSCSKFILEELPKTSVMHAIRLAEQHKMTSIKQRLFDSISIDVFRSLAADHDYKLMNAELKAELLEKWGTFL